MLTQQDEQTIRNVIDELINADESFTVFDVTKIVRQRGLRVRHAEVRDIVDFWHANTACFSHTSTMHTFTTTSGSPVTARVFHPTAVSVGDYDPNRHPVASTASQQPQTATAVIDAPVAVDACDGCTLQDATELRSPDARGRLCIPNTMIRALGLSHGDVVFVYKDKQFQQLILSDDAKKLPDQTPSLMDNFVVDKDQNVRLTDRILREVGLDGVARVIKINFSAKTKDIVVNYPK